MYNWNTPIRYVKSLGPVKAKELNKIGIHTVGDLLEYQPLHYLYPGGVTIAEAKEGYVVIKATIKHIGFAPFRNTVEAILSDDTDKCKAIWYGMGNIRHLDSGITAIFYGKYKGGVLQQPKWTTVESSIDDVYGGFYGVHHATIRAALVEVLGDVELPEMHDWERDTCFIQYHFPACKEQQQGALGDLKFDECLVLQLALAERRKRQRRRMSQPMKWNEDIDTEIILHFPYEFTDEQTDAVNAILTNVTGLNTVMQRLIHGEVGSGKTAVAFYAAMLAALNGKRTLILCPTTILVQQHYDTLRGMGWKDVGLFTGEYATSNTGKNIIIGTHAMLNREWLLKDASLVIIDEFQKFGVEQRAKLQQNNPHLLLLSATPIPRSLAATVFGDLDVSTIRQLPISRGQVITRWVLPEKREAMYEIIEKELTKGHQVYVVYPRISGGDEDVVSAERGFQEVCKRFWDNYDVALLTGRSSQEAKVETLRLFRNEETGVLVSTIIAEVGLDCPNATVMVIEGADRFGLSQLHQLRGRICRSTDTAFCFLVSETTNEKSIARLDVIEKCNDGFLIAEADLRLRGPGEVFSTRQSGLPDLKFVSLVDDYDLIVEAKNMVRAGTVGGGVREMMKLKYGDSLQLGSIV